MRPIEPLALNHSWPLFEPAAQFGLAFLHESHALPSSADDQALERRGIGSWQCDLANNSLTWSGAVYDMFGLPRGASISRSEAVALYEEESRGAMERLRAYAIRHRRGFTLDARIVPAQGEPRWMRLVAMPVCEGARVVRLHGFKQALPDEVLHANRRHPPMDFRPPHP